MIREEKNSRHALLRHDGHHKKDTNNCTECIEIQYGKVLRTFMHGEHYR